jgi:hypothetical protein
MHQDSELDLEAQVEQRHKIEDQLHIAQMNNEPNQEDKQDQLHIQLLVLCMNHQSI